MKYFAPRTLLASVVLLCAPVFAVQPTIQYLDIPPNVSFTASGLCPFDVYEQLIANNEKITTFSDQSGQLKFELITGVNKWLFMNPATGKKIEFNASGPVKFTLQDGNPLLLMHGGGVSFFYIPNPPAGTSNFLLLRGRVIAEVDPVTLNVVNLLTVDGKVQDICQMLE